MPKVNFPITPSYLRSGAGSRLVNSLMSSIGGEVIFDGNSFLMPYKIKIDGSGRIGTVTLAAAVNQTIDLDVAFPNKTFPNNAWIHGAYIRKITDFSGGTIATATGEGGDAGDTDGLLTATDIFTGAGAGIVQTAAAAEFARRFESSFVPTFRFVTTVGNVNAFVAGELDYFVRFFPAVSQLP